MITVYFAVLIPFVTVQITSDERRSIMVTMEFTVSDPLTGTADVNDRGSIIVAMPHIMPCPFDYTIGFDPCRSVMITVWFIVSVPSASTIIADNRR